MCATAVVFDAIAKSSINASNDCIVQKYTQMYCGVSALVPNEKLAWMLHQHLVVHILRHCGLFLMLYLLYATLCGYMDYGLCHAPDGGHACIPRKS